MNQVRRPLLHAQGIGVRAGTWDIVAEASFDVAPGEVLALLGPNGAGKTTLLKAVLGLIPHRGTVELGGRLLAAMPGRERARAIAYVPQQSRLQAGLSAREVVELGRYPHRGDALGLTAADRTVVATALAATDCRHLSERSFATCSGGEQARLLIARALATEATCLVLDEPTASLDISHALALGALIRRLAASGKAILVVLHQLEEARALADRALLLDAGRMVAVGPVAEVLTTSRIRSVYGVEMVPLAANAYRLPVEATCA